MLLISAFRTRAPREPMSTSCLRNVLSSLALLAVALSALFLSACRSNGVAPGSNGATPDRSGDAGKLAADAGSEAAAEGGPPVSNPIVDGPVRFTVVSPTLIRAEYAVDGAFTDATTFTAIARPLATSGYKTAVVNGWRQVSTSAMTLAYLEGSGRFAVSNLTLSLSGAGDTTFKPLFRNSLCPENQVCEAEAAMLGAGARYVSDHYNYTGTGFVDTWEPGATATWTVQGVTPGALSLQLTYAYASNGSDAGEEPATLAWTTTTGGSGTFTLPVLADWDTWGVATAPFTTTSDTFGLTVTCSAQSRCPVNVDSVAVTPSGAPYPTTISPNALGGWVRAMDGFSGRYPLNQGFLSKNGWYLLDDGQTALWDGKNLPTARPKADVDHQDGYVFGYGRNYAQALSDFALIAGTPPMLPRYSFGVIFSEWNAYYDTDWENTIVPAFRAHTTPLDMIGVDTDWKAPSNWDGWNWSPMYFPNPQGFASWAQAQNIHVLLNIHPAIENNDPQYPAVVAIAGTLEDAGAQHGGVEMGFDLGVQAQVTAYASLNQPFIGLGMVPWLDWSGDPVSVSIPGLTPDGWFNQLYASWTNAAGRRGVSWARVGGALGEGGYPNGNDQLMPAGPWADHRTTVEFTGDTFATWDMLQFEAEYTGAAAAIGLAYVSDDIGGFHADHIEPEELYARWVQFGAFQPALRVHSDHGDRLPWEYGPEVEASAEQFMRLREAMLPYNYSLGSEAHTTGMPMARPLWLAFPDQDEAYANDSEYMWGDSLLVAPVTVAGTAATTNVWFPPGTWLSFSDAGLPPQMFVVGPGYYNIATTLASMPVFARAGAIVPLQSYTDNAASAAAVLEPRVFGGSNGSFTLYEDEGEGFGYQSGISATTQMTLSDSTFTIGAMKGTYPNAPSSRAYRVLWSNVTAPKGVSVNGVMLVTGDADAGNAPDMWLYNSVDRTLLIQLSARSTGAPLVIQLM